MGRTHLAKRVLNVELVNGSMCTAAVAAVSSGATVPSYVCIWSCSLCLELGMGVMGQADIPLCSHPLFYGSAILLLMYLLATRSAGGG